jgi:predicted ArsR family transcriptional regulator
MVRSEPVRSRRGRPSLQFSLTDKADSVFPKRYGQLATMILTALQEKGGPEALDELFERVALRHVGTIEPELEDLDFDQKLRYLVGWIGRAGTLAEAEETPDGVKVTIHNCPFRNTALKFPQVCTITPHMLSKVLETPVSQLHSIHRHDPYCSFIVERPNGSGAK